MAREPRIKRIPAASLATIPIKNGQVVKGEHLSILTQVLSRGINDNKIDIDQLISGKVKMYSAYTLAALNQSITAQNPPSKNDYGVVFSDDSDSVEGDFGGVVLYKFDGSAWIYQRRISIVDIYEELDDLNETQEWMFDDMLDYIITVRDTLADEIAGLRNDVYTIDEVDDKLDDKQDKLIAGANVTITDNNVISAVVQSAVNSVSGKTGDVVLGKSDVGLTNVDNTSDLDKPVSTAVEEAIDGVYDYVDTKIGELPTPMQYIGSWNANTNIPTLTANEPLMVGHTYTVSTGGTRFGIDWTAGDVLIFNNGGNPIKWDIHDAAIANKLDKVTTTSSTIQTYGKDIDGAQMMVNVTQGAYPQTIPYRNASAQIAVGNPTAVDHAVNKRYVDDYTLMIKGNTSADLDTITTSGIYRLSDSNANMPTGMSYSQLLVSAAGNTITQFIMGHNNGRILLRGKTTTEGSAWSAWKEFAAKNDVLAKVMTNDGNVRAYVKAGDGSQALLTITSANIGTALVQRTSAGNVNVPNVPSDSTHATSKKYVDDQDATKLDKNTTVTTRNQLYGKLPTGAQNMFDITVAASANTVPYRETGGTLQVGTPTANTHATNKQYVGDNFLGRKDDLGEQDLNNVMTFGTYRQLASASATYERNYPIIEAGVLNVYPSLYNGGETVIQHYHTYSSNRLYIRTKTNNTTWTAWKELAGKTDLDTKLDKVTATSTYREAYVKAANGTQTTMPITSGAVENYITQRAAGGHLTVPETPTQNLHAASKSYVDTKLEKNTAASTYGLLYGKMPDGSQYMQNLEVNALPGMVPVRTSASQILVPETPVNDNHAASKKYVDDKIGELPTPMQYIGSWNANTNTPTIADLPNTSMTGHTYTVSVGGNRFGIDWTVGDVLIIDGTGNPVKWDVHDAAIGNKLDKVTSTTTRNQAYVKNIEGGQEMMDVSQGTIANQYSIPMRHYQSQTFDVGTPIADLNVANKRYVDTKQEKLISGTNIKTINGQSVLGSGNISISGGSSGSKIRYYWHGDTVEFDFLARYQIELIQLDYSDEGRIGCRLNFDSHGLDNSYIDLHYLGLNSPNTNHPDINVSMVIDTNPIDSDLVTVLSNYEPYNINYFYDWQSPGQKVRCTFVEGDYINVLKVTEMY